MFRIMTWLLRRRVVILRDTITGRAYRTWEISDDCGSYAYVFPLARAFLVELREGGLVRGVPCIKEWWYADDKREVRKLPRESILSWR